MPKHGKCNESTAASKALRWVTLHFDGTATRGVGGVAVPSGMDVRPAGHEDAVGDFERRPKAESESSEALCH